MKLPRYIVSDHRNGHATLIRERGAMSTGIGTFLLATAEMLATNLNAEMAEAETWQQGAEPTEDERVERLRRQLDSETQDLRNMLAVKASTDALREQCRNDLREVQAEAITLRHLNIIDALIGQGSPSRIQIEKTVKHQHETPSLGS